MFGHRTVEEREVAETPAEETPEPEKTIQERYQYFRQEMTGIEGRRSELRRALRTLEKDNVILSDKYNGLLVADKDAEAEECLEKLRRVQTKIISTRAKLTALGQIGTGDYEKIIAGTPESALHQEAEAISQEGAIEAREAKKAAEHMRDHVIPEARAAYLAVLKQYGEAVRHAYNSAIRVCMAEKALPAEKRSGVGKPLVPIS